MNSKGKTYIINCDSLPAAYIDYKDEKGNYLMKNVRALVEKGANFKACSCILPAVTSTNHTTIMTSTYPGTSGVFSVAAYYKGLTADYNIDVSKFGPNEILVKTLFETCKAHGLKTAFVGGKSWVGKLLSRGCDILVIGAYDTEEEETGPGRKEKENFFEKKRPPYYEKPKAYILGGRKDIGDQEFPPRVYIADEKEYNDFFKDKGIWEIFMKSLFLVKNTAGKRCITIPAFNSAYCPNDQWIRQMAEKVIHHDDPDFMYILFPGMDINGHMYGCLLDPESANVFTNFDALYDQLISLDEQIGKLTDLIFKKNKDANIIFTADHGMRTISSLEYPRLQDFKESADRSHLLPLYIGAVFAGFLNDFLSFNMDFSSFFKRADNEVKEKFNQYLELLVNKMEEILPGIVNTGSALGRFNSNSIDIRQILAEGGIRMRAHTTDGCGDYDWLCAEGPHCYIYNIGGPTSKQKTINKIKKILYEFNLKNSCPIWEILDEEQQKNGINRKTGLPFNLYSEYYHKDVKQEIMWPDLFIFLDKNFSFRLYNDIIRGGYVAGGVPLEALEKILELEAPFLPGLHGTYSEQNVPLFFLGKNIKPACVFNHVVSTLDIVPTILDLNGWDKEEMPDIQGHSLFDLVKE